MALKDYHKKRDLKKTPEPSKKGKILKNKLLFCVQKHDARRLHYDFRLEYNGVLLSWAVPKEPSSDPSIKRLAVHVEDHPLSYRTFEGVIPEGNYGAGTVELWDEGTYYIQGCDTKKDAEKAIQKQLKKGHLDFCLDGKKLKGFFSLIKMKNSQKGNEWLLIKKKETSEKPKPQLKKKPMPTKIEPMLATLVDKPFNRDKWLFEMKWDGFRALSYVKKDKVIVESRNHISFNERFKPIVDGLKSLKTTAIFDGEIIAIDQKGQVKFQSIQNYLNTQEGELQYQVFDLLYYDGYDLRDMPLIDRKALLKKVLEKQTKSCIKYSDHIEDKGVPFFNEIKKMGLEGVIGKNGDASYIEGRSLNWVKFKNISQQEVVIGGFTKPRGSRKKFGALLIGVYQGDEFKYIGHVGSGFDQKLLDVVFDRMKPLIQIKCPFSTPPKPNMPVTWVKPKLICEVKFTEWTNDNSMRHPIFLGLRVDKKARDVTREIPKKESGLTLTHLDKIYWPKDKITKKMLLDYYKSVSSYILPYLKNRPTVMHRFPNGIDGESFYQKDIETPPQWLKTCAVQHESRLIHYPNIQNLDALLYIVNLGSIELHPFNSNMKNIDNPTYCVIDLDPVDIPFAKVIETAQVIHELLNELDIPNYCKTSGSRGLHICIPMNAKYSHEQVQQFALLIVTIVHQRIPKFTSLDRSPAKRQKKVYLDYLQNRFGQTLAVPYGVRARPGATVSTPLDWKEVKKGLDPKDFTIKNTVKRIEKKGDLFQGVLGIGLNLKSKIKEIEKLLE